MKARFPLIFLTSALILSLCGCQLKKEEDTQDVTTENYTSEDLLDHAEPEILPVVSDAKIESMAPAIDALIRCCWENGYSYSDDDWFFWSAMHYHLGANYNLRNELVTVNDSTVTVPRLVVQEFATSLFSSYSDLPEIPANMNDQITYDDEQDSYTFSLGDRGLSELVLAGVTKNDNGSISVIADLNAVDENPQVTICEWKVTLVPNAYADGISNPLFYYSVSGMESVPEKSTVTNFTNETAIFEELEDNHTAIFSFDGEEKVFQIYDDEIRTLVENAVPGSSYTFSYTTDPGTKVNTIYEFSE